MSGVGKSDTVDRENQFREFVNRSRSRLLRTATLLSSGDSHRAEDLVQTVLVRIYVAWPQVRDDTRDAYARKALINAHLDERRRPFLRKELTKAELPEVVADEVQPLDTEAVVFQALAKLPPRMRAAVILRHVQDVGVAETAQILGCSEGTVKSQTARGLAHLRELLRDLIRDINPTSVGATSRSPKETAGE